MRKLIVSMNITLDGCMSGRDGDLGWHFNYWTPEMSATLEQELDEADTILLGRLTFEAMSVYWTARACDPQLPREDIAFANAMNNYRKLVFSNTMRQVNWYNSSIVRGQLARNIKKIKSEGSKNIIVYGSGQLVEGLVQANLVDEFHLWIYPLVLGDGRRLFGKTSHQLSLKPIRTTRFDSGVVILYYRTLDHSQFADAPSKADNNSIKSEQFTRY